MESGFALFDLVWSHFYGVTRTEKCPPPREWSERVPPWSEFYDFDLFKGSSEALKDRRLRKLTFVVFDMEATSLRPNEGDERSRAARFGWPMAAS